MSGTYFKSNSYIDGGAVKNVSISQSSLDMNNSPITSVQDPSNPQDVATKNYVDLISSRITISLSSTNYTLISTKLKGAVQLIIEADVSDGPCATFQASKSKSSKEAHIFRQTSAPGDSINKEQLVIRWSPGSGIEMKKTNNGFNGDYIIKIL
jgi:hypothetical protein